MTKKHLIIIFLVLNTLCAFSWQKDTIYGKVKSIREQITFLNENIQNAKLFSSEGDYGHYGFYSAKFTKSRFHSWWYNTSWVHYINYYKEFNEQGKPKYEIWFYKNNDTVTELTYKYDKRDNLIHLKDAYFDDYSSENYKYNHEDKIISAISYSSYDPDDYLYTNYIYDDNSRLIEVKNYNEYGRSSGQKFTYDEKGRKKKSFRYSPYTWVEINRTTTVQERDSIGIYNLNHEYFYDDNNKITETHNYSEDEDDSNKVKLTGKLRNTYSNGLLEKIESIRTDGEVGHTVLYKYDKFKRKIKESRFSSKYPQNNIYSDYTYDDQGNIIKLIYTENNTATKVEFKYTFDKKNNWVKQIKLVDGQELFVWSRKIEYYE